MRRPAISLGDALRAFQKLSPEGGATRDAIVSLLGIAEEPFIPAPPTTGAMKPSSSDHAERAQRREALPTALMGREAERQDSPLPAAQQAVVARLTRTAAGSGRVEPPAWVRVPDPGFGVATPWTPPPPPPLLRHSTRRGIVSAALATWVPEGRLDVERMTSLLAARRPVTRLFRHLMPTLRHGVQLLLDRGAGMDPFTPDQEQLVAVLSGVLSPDRMRVLRFAGCPSRGAGPGGPATWTAWEPPPPGVPVLVVTDLGIGGPLLDGQRAATDEWLRFARRVRGLGHAVVGLVPYEATRWPPVLARVMTLLHWSERTTAGEVRRAARERMRR
jgi:hypothetical protein